MDATRSKLGFTMPRVSTVYLAGSSCPLPYFTSTSVALGPSGYSGSVLFPGSILFVVVVIFLPLVCRDGSESLLSDKIIRSGATDAGSTTSVHYFTLFVPVLSAMSSIL